MNHTNFSFLKNKLAFYLLATFFINITILYLNSSLATRLATIIVLFFAIKITKEVILLIAEKKRKRCTFFLRSFINKFLRLCL
jgi:hypothetical protein